MSSPILRKSRPFQVKLLSAAVSLSLLSSAGGALAQQAGQEQPELEEVIVTGSLIRRSEGFNSASPLTQITAEDLQAQGTINMGQVVQNMTMNYGTSITEGIQANSDESTGINLRGLGERATLQLVDGKRVTSNVVQLLMPTIAIERMDIVADGAAALYGTDAVAGVVNFIPYKSYDGVEVQLFEEGDSRGDYRDREVSFLAGTALSDNIDIVLAGSYREQGELKWSDRPKHYNSGLTYNGGSNPGNHRVPLRDENGNLTGESQVLPEPLCGSVEENPASSSGGPPFGALVGGRCFADIPWNFKDQSGISNFYGNVNYDVSADLTLSAQFYYSRILEYQREISAFPGGRVADLPTVRGELPGNPFRAMSSDGRALYAVPRRDADGNIVTDGYGRPLPQRGNDGNFLLAPNQFASMDQDPQGGVPFYEDVRLDAWLPFGKHRANTMPQRFIENGNVNPQDNDRRNARFALEAEFTVPYVQNWQGRATYLVSRSRDNSQANQNFSFGAIEQGLNCDVINDVDACFNPFAATEPRFRNSQAVADAIATSYRWNNIEELQTFDLVFNGTIPLGDFELPGGEVGAAIGYQRREETLDLTPPAGQISGDLFNGNQLNPRTDSRYINSGFAELALPVLPNMEISANVRDETFSTGQSTVIDKYGITYEPFNWLGLRATMGEAFIAPSLSQLNAPVNCGLENIDDPFTSFQGFITDCRGGNPDLISETSDVISAGFELFPLDGLSVSATWSEVDFNDRIVTTVGQQIADLDFNRFQQATGFMPTAATPYPTLEQLRQWINDPRSEGRILRDPDNIEIIQRVNTSDSNAASVAVRSVDLEVDYARSFRDWGEFRFNLLATRITQFEYQESEISPVQDALGKQNNNTGIAPAIPKWRANARLSWSRGPHTVSTTVRYVDEMEYDAPQFDFQQAFPFSTWRHVDRINAWTQADAFYTYQGLSVPAIGGTLSLTAGMRNMFDREAQKVGMTSGSIQELQDPLGRIVYARVRYEF